MHFGHCILPRRPRNLRQVCKRRLRNRQTTCPAAPILRFRRRKRNLLLPETFEQLVQRGIAASAAVSPEQRTQATKRLTEAGLAPVDAGASMPDVSEQLRQALGLVMSLPESVRRVTTTLSTIQPAVGFIRFVERTKRPSRNRSRPPTQSLTLKALHGRGRSRPSCQHQTHSRRIRIPR